MVAPWNWGQPGGRAVASTYGFLPGFDFLPIDIDAIHDYAIDLGGIRGTYSGLNIQRDGQVSYLVAVFGDDEGSQTSYSGLAIRLEAVFDGPASFFVPYDYAGTTVTSSSPDLTAASIGYLDADGTYTPAFAGSGLVPFNAGDLLTALSGTETYYGALVSLFDNKTVLDGTPLNDDLEVGAGNDTVHGNAGDDTVFKFRGGDLTYFGGAGHDTLDFSADGGPYAFPTPFVQQLVVNLSTGTGRNPYGGKLTLTSVEEIRTTSQADKVIGSKHADTVDDIYGGGDTFLMKGGRDTVKLFSAFQNTTVDGGAGRDTIELTTSGFGGYTAAQGYGVQVLNLSNPAASSQDFAGVTIRNVENVTIYMVQDYIHLDLIGSTNDETFTISNFFARMHSLVKLDGKGGDDVLNGGYGIDLLLGGSGADMLKGNDGDDVIRGGAGDDLVIGGAGRDKLSGNKGADIFVFDAGFGRDRLQDYQDGIDKLDFSGHDGVTRYKDLKIRDTDLGVAILDGDGGRIDLVGIDKADIDRSDFLF